MPIADCLSKGSFFLLNKKPTFFPKLPEQDIVAYAMDYSQEFREFFTYIVEIDGESYNHVLEYLIYRFGTVGVKEHILGDKFYFVWSVDKTLSRRLDINSILVTTKSKEWPSLVGQRFFHTLQILIKGEREYVKLAKDIDKREKDEN